MIGVFKTPTDPRMLWPFYVTITLKPRVTETAKRKSEASITEKDDGKGVEYSSMKKKSQMAREKETDSFCEWKILR